MGVQRFKEVVLQYGRGWKLSKLAKDKLPDEQVGVFVIQRQWYRNLSMDSLQRIIITAREFQKIWYSFNTYSTTANNPLK
jgi:hypothetical protein